MTQFVPLTEDEYEAIWRRVESRLAFKPDYHESRRPAITEPEPFVTYGLNSVTDEDLDGRITDILLAAFRKLSSSEKVLYSLDWQHECYRYSPHVVDDLGPIGWFPDGDYYFQLAADLSFGTFGHPWQESLCVFGADLLEAVQEPLERHLPVIRSSRR